MLTFSRRRVIDAIAVVVVFAAVTFIVFHRSDSPAGAAGADVSPVTDSPGGSGPQMNWESPLNVGSAVPTLTAAEKLITFTPALPVAALGATPSSFETSAETDSLAAIYKDAQLGRFVVIERPSETNEAELQSLAGPCDKQGCEGTWQMTDLANGEDGLLIKPPVGGQSTTLIFLHGGLIYTVMGPPDTFSTDDAIKVGNDILVGLSVTG